MSALREECGVFASHRDLGLVSDVFTGDIMAKFPQGSMAVGHIRYGTTDRNIRANCQPMEVNHQKGRMALAHNGNLSNAAQLRPPDGGRGFCAGSAPRRDRRI